MFNSAINPAISYLKNIYSLPASKVYLNQFLNACKNGEMSAENLQRIKDVQKAKEIYYNSADDNEREAAKKLSDKAKASLPAVTISGLFEGKRTKNNLKQHSGLIAIDIDGLTEAGEPQEVRDQLINFDEILFSSLSASHTGVFAILRIAYPDKHLEHFKQLVKDMAHYNFDLDIACKDTTRLRVITYDKDAKYNGNATEYKRYIQVKNVVKYAEPNSYKVLNSNGLGFKLEQYEQWKAGGIECPQCNDKKYARYRDEGGKGNVIANHVGLCNHRNSCGYHYPPKQFFKDNPTVGTQPINVRLTPRTHKQCAVTVDEYGNYFRGDKGYPDDWDFHLPDYTPLTEQQKANAIPITTK